LLNELKVINGIDRVVHCPVDTRIELDNRGSVNEALFEVAPVSGLQLTVESMSQLRLKLYDVDPFGNHIPQNLRQLVRGIG